jgi:hypothetical protein
LLAAALLAAGAVWAPLAFGASGTWPRFCLELTLAAATILWAASASRPAWLTAAPLVVAGLGLLQLVPLPDSLLVWLAPVSAGAWKVATAGMPGSMGRVSVDPGATWAGMRSVLISAGAMATVVGLARHQKPRKLLLAGVGLSGVLVILAAAVWGQVGEDRIMLGFLDLTGPIFPSQSPLIVHAQSTGVGVGEWVAVGDQRYWSESGWIGGCVGTFFYANHLAAAVCLTLPLILSWWLSLTTDRLPAWSRWLVVVAVAAAGGWVVAVLACSRAGAGAYALTLAAFLALVAPFRWLRWAWGAVTAALALGILAFSIVTFMPRETVLAVVPAEFHKQAADILVAGRADPARVAVRAFAASPLLGTGLDTFQDVFPRFYTDRYTLYYAHNEYAQLLAETGLIGVGLLVALAAFLVPKAIRFWRDAPGAYRVLNAGPWAALAGIAAHSAFDWNLHLPAIALLIAIVAGLATSSVPGRKAGANRKPWIPESLPRWLLVAGCVVAVVGMARDAISETVLRRIRAAIVADRLAEKDTRKPDATAALLDAIDAGTSLARWDGGDADLLVALGQACLHRARSLPPGAERDATLAEAERWFQRARSAAAMVRGLPEPLPRTVGTSPAMK